MFSFAARINDAWPWVCPILILLACVFISAIALISQYVGGHHPCTLCIAQRTSYVVAAVIAGAAAYIGRSDAQNLERCMLLGVCSLAFMFGTFTAFQHVGVEQGWWDGAVFCKGIMADFVGNADSQRLGFNQLFSVPEMTCSEGTWSLFGFTMATYNLLANFGLMLFSALLALTALRGILLEDLLQSRSSSESQ
ncbi:MAG: disulfide bond formation protein B [Alphaproteobacteria bacterium TMED89]|nr:MAG: disulfide bond formation protein B [Alphaproteobacteria bacterium TMED89]